VQEAENCEPGVVANGITPIPNFRNFRSAVLWVLNPYSFKEIRLGYMRFVVRMRHHPTL
jgi:hypothetical protein